MSNGMPVTIAKGDRRTAQVPSRPEGHVRRPHPQRRRTADAASLRREALDRRTGDGNPHRHRDQRLLRRPAHRRGAGEDRPGAARTSRPGIRNATAVSRAWMSARPWSSPAASPPAGRPVWIRFVLVPGLTDDPEDIAKIAEFAAGLGNVERVDVLPFHQMGRYKWKNLGIEVQASRTLSRRQPKSSSVRWRFSGLKALRRIDRRELTWRAGGG